MQIPLNTVPAENQMANADVVSFLGDADAPLKILILGNSITRHGPSAEIGWHGDWGMAASAPGRDYVHRLHAMLRESGRESRMMIRQASHWERHFGGPGGLRASEAERAFGADVVVFRLGENVGKRDFDVLCESIVKFVSFVAHDGAMVVLTSGFWINEARDRALREAAERLGCPCAEIGCTDEDMMALGRFAHSGVSAHPGDCGMEMIARRIFEAITGEKRD